MYVTAQAGHHVLGPSKDHCSVLGPSKDCVFLSLPKREPAICRSWRHFGGRRDLIEKDPGFRSLIRDSRVQHLEEGIRGWVGWNLVTMQALQRQASCTSGVRLEDAQAIDDVNLYERLGFDTFVQLSTNFYENVYNDEQQWFRSIFANSTKDDAIQNQFEFLIQRMGGPPMYVERKGNSALIARHGPYPITERAAVRWLYHMKSALDDTTEIDFDSKNRLFNFFKHTAFFLVAGKELTNHHRLIGYGVGGKHMGRA